MTSLHVCGQSGWPSRPLGNGLDSNTWSALQPLMPLTHPDGFHAAFTCFCLWWLYHLSNVFVSWECIISSSVFGEKKNRVGSSTLYVLGSSPSLGLLKSAQSQPTKHRSASFVLPARPTLCLDHLCITSWGQKDELIWLLAALQDGKFFKFHNNKQGWSIKLCSLYLDFSSQEIWQRKDRLAIICYSLSLLLCSSSLFIALKISPLFLRLLGHEQWWSPFFSSHFLTFLMSSFVCDVSVFLVCVKDPSSSLCTVCATWPRKKSDFFFEKFDKTKLIDEVDYCCTVEKRRGCRLSLLLCSQCGILVEVATSFRQWLQITLDRFIILHFLHSTAKLAKRNCQW